MIAAGPLAGALALGDDGSLAIIGAVALALHSVAAIAVSTTVLRPVLTGSGAGRSGA